MKTYAIIPARSGSVGLADKNIKLINNKPLLSYSISFAKKLDGINKIICSTDSNKYAEIALKYGAEVPFLRSKKASSGKAMEEDILKDLRLKFLQNKIDEPDLIVWLRPTFVFRSKVDVNEWIRVLKENKNFSAARTVIEAENRLYKINKKNNLEPSFNDNNKSMVRRQDMESSFRVYSTDVFRFKDNQFNNNFLGNKIFPVVSNRICGLDIDDSLDFEIVKNLINFSPNLVNEYL